MHGANLFTLKREKCPESTWSEHRHSKQNARKNLVAIVSVDI